MNTTNNQLNELGHNSIFKLLIKFSIPAIIGMVVNMLYNVIDRIYIGNMDGIGGLAITGVGLTMPITQIITGFGMLIGIGTSASISLAYGRNKKDTAQNYLGNGLTGILIISFCVAIFGNIFAEDILHIFGASENTMPFALDYIRPLMLGTICNLFAFGLNHSISSDGNPKIGMITMIIGAIINIILDPIFIYAIGLGIKGAAYATVISQFIAGCWVLYYFTKSKKSQIKITTKDMKLKWKLFKGILAIGSAPFLMQLVGSLVQVISNKTLYKYGGDLAIGAMAVIASVCSIFIMPIFGLNQGAQPIIGYNYGAKKFDRVKKTYLYGLYSCTAVLILSFLAVELFPYACVSMFNQDPELTNIAVSGMRIYLCTLPIIGIQMTASNFYQAIGKPTKAMIISLTRQVIFLIPAFLILPSLMNGLTGVWYAGPIADALAVAVSAIIVFKDIHKMCNQQDNIENELKSA